MMIFWDAVREEGMEEHVHTFPTGNRLGGLESYTLMQHQHDQVSYLALYTYGDCPFL